MIKGDVVIGTVSIPKINEERPSYLRAREEHLSDSMRLPSKIGGYDTQSCTSRTL